MFINMGKNFGCSNTFITMNFLKNRISTLPYLYIRVAVL